MTRRITIPAEHVAVILPAETADDLMSLMKQLRRCKPTDENSATRTVAGDVMLALLEAKEA